MKIFSTWSLPSKQDKLSWLRVGTLLHWAQQPGTAQHKRCEWALKSYKKRLTSFTSIDKWTTLDDPELMADWADSSSNLVKWSIFLLLAYLYLSAWKLHSYSRRTLSDRRQCLLSYEKWSMLKPFLQKVVVQWLPIFQKVIIPPTECLLFFIQWGFVLKYCTITEFWFTVEVPSLWP